MYHALSQLAKMLRKASAIVDFEARGLSHTVCFGWFRKLAEDTAEWLLLSRHCKFHVIPMLCSLRFTHSAHNQHLPFLALEQKKTSEYRYDLKNALTLRPLIAVLSQVSDTFASVSPHIPEDFVSVRDSCGLTLYSGLSKQPYNSLRPL